MGQLEHTYRYSKEDFKFGTDGIRGRCPEDLTPEIASHIALGHTSLLRTIYPEESAFIISARDTRPSGKLLAKAAYNGIRFFGGQHSITAIGVAPTPATLYLANALDQFNGAQVYTASHNPANDNGIKCTVGPDKLTPEQAEFVSQAAYSTYRSNIPGFGRKIEGYHEDGKVYIERYKTDLIANIESLFGELPLAGKIVALDCANGATMGLGPEIFEKLGARVILTPNGNSPDGQINDECGATKLGNLKQFLKLNSSLLDEVGFIGGIAFDGDGDRMMGVGATNNNGQFLTEVFDGNRALAIFAEAQPAVVGTVYTNPATRRYLAKIGVKFIECDNGDIAVTKTLQHEGLIIGSEFTGHHVDLRWLSSGDGLRAAAILTCQLAKRNQNMYQQARQLPLAPEVMINVNVKELELTVKDLKSLASDLDGDAKAQLEQAVVRASGTEPVLRIWGSDSSLTTEEVSSKLRTLALNRSIKTE